MLVSFAKTTDIHEISRIELDSIIHNLPPRWKHAVFINVNSVDVNELLGKASHIEQVQFIDVYHLLQLFNSRLKLRPPLTLEEIKISHRVGKLQVEHQETEYGEGGTLMKSRPIFAKFVSRRTKARVMAARKHLKPKAHQDTIFPDAENVDNEVNHDDEENPNQVPLPQTIYIADDLTRNRAKIAFRARQLKRDGKLRDTWVFDCSIMIKDNTGRVSKVTSIDDLNIYWIRSYSYPMFVSPNYRHWSWHNKYDVLMRFM